MRDSVQFVVDNLPALAEGLRVTVELSVIGCVGTLALGFVVAAARASRHRAISAAALMYIEFLRNTPFVGQIFFLYFGLPALGVTLSGFTIGWVSLILWGAAYAAENYRAGLEAVPSHYLDGALALGFSWRQALARIVWPIGVRIAVPSLGNTAAAVVKNSSYLSLIAVADLTQNAINIVNGSFRVTEMFLVMGVVYLTLVALVSLAFNLVERRFGIEGRM